MRKSILILYSDTGGGHRSAARAIREAILRLGRFDLQPQIELVDVFSTYSPFPINRFPEWYPRMIRYGGRFWGLGYRATDGTRRVRALLRFFRRMSRQVVRELLDERRPDLIVSVHPLLNTSILWELGRRRPGFITVITDLTNAHAWWYAPEADLCLVPTADVKARAIRCGLDPRRVKVTGFPVSAPFMNGLPAREALRAELGWRLDRPVIMIAGGGAGIGPLFEVAKEVARSEVECELVIMAGRNHALYRRAMSEDWKFPVHVFGFTSEMARLMKACDMLVTKAGPNTIMEACALGLPLVLVGAIPALEEGNVKYVEQHGAGVWAPHPARAVRAIRRWIENPAELHRASQAASRLAQPDATAQIAREILAYLSDQEPSRGASREAV